MDFNFWLEIIVLIAIIIEIYSLARHAKLEHRVIEHINQMDERMNQLDEDISVLNKLFDSSNIRNLGVKNEEQEK